MNQIFDDEPISDERTLHNGGISCFSERVTDGFLKQCGTLLLCRRLLARPEASTGRKEHPVLTNEWAEGRPHRPNLSIFFLLV